MKQLIVFIFLLANVTLMAQSDHGFLRSGDKSYQDEDFTGAEENYRKAIEKNSTSLKGNFNLGNSIYRQERFEEAVKHYEAAARNATSNVARSNAYHNLGNAFLQNQKLEEAVTAYKNALRNNPKDMDTKYNLSFAQKMLKAQQQQQEQNKDCDNKEESENQDENQEQQEQEEQNQDQESEQQNQDQQGEEKEQQEKKDQQNQEQKEEEQQQQGENKKEEEKEEGEAKAISATKPKHGRSLAVFKNHG